MTTKTTITATQTKALNYLNANANATRNETRNSCNTGSCKALVRKGLVDIVEKEFHITRDNGEALSYITTYFKINDAGRAACTTK